MNPLAVFLVVALGGALGACGRYGAALLLEKSSLPASISATLLVNIVGSFFIGVLFVLCTQKQILPEFVRPLVITGFLGGLTTFSSFSLESMNLLLASRYIDAFTYILLSVFLSLLACFVGILVTR